MGYAPENRSRLVEGSEFGLPLIASVGAIQSRSASRVSWHAHDGFELLFVLDGATKYETESGVLVALPGGCFVVVPPGVKHRGWEDVRMPTTMCGLVLEAMDESRPGGSGLSESDLKWMQEQLSRNVLVSHPMGPELLRAVRLLRQRASEFPRGEHAVAAILGLRLSALNTLFEAVQQCARSSRLEPGNVMAKACLYLEGHFREPLHMGALETITGYGRARLFQLFKRETGLAPNDYLQRLRVQKALESLGATDLSVTEIAHALGFSSSQYFSKVFRKYQGRTPTEWRHRKKAERAP